MYVCVCVCALQVGAGEQQISVSGPGVLSRTGGQHCGFGHSAPPDQQVWLGVCLLGVRHTGAHLAAALGHPCSRSAPPAPAPRGYAILLNAEPCKAVVGPLLHTSGLHVPSVYHVCMEVWQCEAPATCSSSIGWSQTCTKRTAASCLVCVQCSTARLQIFVSAYPSSVHAGSNNLQASQDPETLVQAWVMYCGFRYNKLCRFLYLLCTAVACVEQGCVCVCVRAGSGRPNASSKAESGVQSLSDVPWNAFRKSKALWGLVCAHCSFGVGPLVCLSWLPSYYSDVSLLPPVSPPALPCSDLSLAPTCFTPCFALL